MELRGIWLLPRTRVGQIGAVITAAAFVWVVWAGTAGVTGMVALGAAAAVVWTAILRHGDASLVLWVIAGTSLAYFLYTVVW